LIQQEFINYEYLSLLPSFVAILLALVSRNVLLSLFVGVATGLFILNDFNLLKTFFSFFDLLFLQLQQSWIQKTLIFALLVGAVVKMLEKSGGVEGIITLLHYKYKIVNSKKSALF
jgi:Na+/H+ antiporter NhaC